MVTFYDQRPVSKGKGLTLHAVKERLKDISENKKSTYYKGFHEGRIQVHRVADKTYHAKKGDVKYNIYEVRAIEVEGFTIECGECEQSFMNFTKDYLCPDCRAKINDWVLSPPPD